MAERLDAAMEIDHALDHASDHGSESTPMSGTPVERVLALTTPIVADLGLEVYDVEQRGGIMRVTVDTPPGSPGGVDLDTLALVTRLLSRELDHLDPIPGRYTLEVTSPGVERSLRTPAHFRREVGKTIALRLSDATAEERRMEGVLVAADETAATVRIDDPSTGEPLDRVVPYARIDRARTVFVWGPAPKPGGKGSKKSKGSPKGAKGSPKGSSTGSPKGSTTSPPAADSSPSSTSPINTEEGS